VNIGSHWLTCEGCRIYRAYLIIAQSLRQAREAPQRLNDEQIAAAIYGVNRTVEVW